MFEKIFLKIRNYIMEFSLIVLNQVVVMLLLMGVGALCFKLKLINSDANKNITNIVLYIVSPMVILNSFLSPFEKDKATLLGYAFLLAVLSHVIAIAVSYIFLRKKSERLPIERFAVIYSNCGFMAFPLIEALFGSEGIFFASAYITVFNLLSWTHGLLTISGKSDKKSILKALYSPVVISVALGLIIYFVGIPVPLVMKETIRQLSLLNTPLAMLVTGVNLAQSDIIASFKTKRCYYVVFLTCILIPLIATVSYSFLPLPKDIILINLIATACPSAVTSVLFSGKCGKDYRYASSLVTITTVLSVITIPSIVFIAGLLL